MCDAGMFFVTLDPVGKHWALRVGADGKEAGGKDVWVLGGMHGDVPLEPGSGALIADTVVSHPGRYVLDVSTFETDADQDRFALDFAKRLFRRKAKDPGYPLLLILDEALEGGVLPPTAEQWTEAGGEAFAYALLWPLVAPAYLGRRLVVEHGTRIAKPVRRVETPQQRLARARRELAEAEREVGL